MARNEGRKRVASQRLSDGTGATAANRACEVRVGRHTTARNLAQRLIDTPLKVGDTGRRPGGRLGGTRMHEPNVGKRATGVKEVWVGNPWGYTDRPLNVRAFLCRASEDRLRSASRRPGHNLESRDAALLPRMGSARRGGWRRPATGVGAARLDHAIWSAAPSEARLALARCKVRERRTRSRGPTGRVAVRRKWRGGTTRAVALASCSPRRRPRVRVRATGPRHCAPRTVGGRWPPWRRFGARQASPAACFTQRNKVAGTRGLGRAMVLLPADQAAEFLCRLCIR